MRAAPIGSAAGSSASAAAPTSSINASEYGFGGSGGGASWAVAASTPAAASGLVADSGGATGCSLAGTSERAAPIGGRRPGCFSSRKKTLKMAVMTWKCFECGRRFKKRSTKHVCVQYPTCARTMSACGPRSLNSIAKSEPAGDGKGDHPRCPSLPYGATMVAIAEHWPGVAAPGCPAKPHIVASRSTRTAAAPS